MTAAGEYLDAAIGVLRRLRDEAAGAMGVASALVAEAIASDHRVWVAATSHTLHTELVFRAGGLAAVHPLGETPDLSHPLLDLSAGSLGSHGTFELEAGDVVLVGTNAGTDAGTVEVAIQARAAGCLVVALTSVAYEQWPDVIRDHPSGQVLGELADVVVDIGGALGDAAVTLDGLDTPIGPTSGVALVAASWAILLGASERLLARGLVPITYRSAQLPGAEAEFEERTARYETTRRGYEPAAGKSSSTRTGLPSRSDS